MSRLTTLRRVVVSLALPAVGWKALSLGNAEMFPPPEAIAGQAYTFVVDGDLMGRSALYHLALTLFRVGLATGIAVGLGVVIGIAMGVDETIERVVSFWLPVWMTPPDIVVILITMVILGFNTTAVVVAVSFVYTPFGLVTIWEGVRDVDAELVEMAEAFEAGRLLVWRYVYVPHLASYIFAATRTVFGMTWKVAVIAEVLGIDAGVGARIRFWYTAGETKMVLAYTVLFVGVVLIVEYGALSPLQDRVFRYRTAEA